MSPNSVEDNEFRSSHDSRLTLWLRPPMPPMPPTPPSPLAANRCLAAAAEAIDGAVGGGGDVTCRSRVSSTRLLFSWRRRSARTRRSTSILRQAKRLLRG